MRLAKVTVTGYNSDKATDSLDFDPIALPTIKVNGETLVPTDFDALNHLTEILAMEEADRQIVNFGLVWDSDGTPVKSMCECGEVCEVAGEMLCDEDTLVCHDCL